LVAKIVEGQDWPPTRFLVTSPTPPPRGVFCACSVPYTRRDDRQDLSGTPCVSPQPPIALESWPCICSSAGAPSQRIGREEVGAVTKWDISGTWSASLLRVIR